MEFNGDDFRKALMEETRDRPNQELANAIIAGGDSGTLTAGVTLQEGDNSVALFFKKVDPTVISGITAEAAFESGKWGENGQNLIDGYTNLYFGDSTMNQSSLEQNVIAIQDRGSGQFFGAPGFTVTILKSPQVRDKFLVQPLKAAPGNAPDATSAGRWNSLVGTDGAPIAGLNSTGVFVLNVKVDAGSPAIGKKIFGFGRYNSESDFEGNYLGKLYAPSKSVRRTVKAA
jgi:hypothetical protein